MIQLVSNKIESKTSQQNKQTNKQTLFVLPPEKEMKVKTIYICDIGGMWTKKEREKVIS